MGGKRLLLLRSTAPPPPPSSHFDRVLLSRIDSSNVPLADADADAVVQNLRARYPRDYSRIKLLPFSRRVRTLLHQHHRPISTNDHEQDDEEDDDHHHRGDPQTSFENNDELPTTTTTKKKRRKRPHDDDEEEEEDDDAVFESPVEPQFDVTRSMLLAHYQKKQQQHLLLLNNKNNKKKNKQSSTTSFVEEVENAVERRPPTPRRRVLELWGDGSRTEEGPAGDVDVKKGEEDAGGTPRFRDFGGIDWVIEELVDEVIVPLCHPQLPRWLGVRPMAGILLHGPPGCGKTRLAHAIANETGVPFYKISATEVVSGISGESEGNIRELFRKAYRTAPSIVFIDEIDAIASKRENMQKEMERRIVTQLMTCMDESHQKLGSTGSDSDSDASDKKPGYVLVIGATNRPDAVDPALRRPGRFDREIVLGVPNENARKEILKVLTGKLRVEGTLDLLKIARSASGFVGADLKALVNKAGNLAMKRIINRRKKFMNEGKEEDKCDKWWKQPWTYEELQELSITMSDFEEATKLVQPSLRREGFSSIPNVKWDDVGGLNSLQKEFERYIVQHIKNPDIYLELGVKSQTGFLLYGPPGCGKTLIAKAVAHEAGANFIHIKGPELLNKYVGESELAVRTIFSRARTCSPCVLFFDEIDALTTKRGKEGGWVVERLLNQLLIELDGADERHGVHVIGATNRVEVVDPAILRPGRLGKVMYVPLPDADERILILKALVREKPLGAAVDLDAIGHSESCRNLSGADLAEVVKEAAMLAVEERLEVMKVGGVVQLNSVIKSSHFEQALKKVSPSVSEEERMYYEVLSKRFRGT